MPIYVSMKQLELNKSPGKE